MITTKANAKENLGEFICLSITKAKANLHLQISLVIVSVRLVTRIAALRNHKSLATAIATQKITATSKTPSEANSLDSGIASFVWFL